MFTSYSKHTDLYSRLPLKTKTGTAYKLQQCGCPKLQNKYTDTWGYIHCKQDQTLSFTIASKDSSQKLRQEAFTCAKPVGKM